MYHQNSNLGYVFVNNNNLNYLNLNNGNNSSINSYNSLNNPNLLCINVDDYVYSSLNWTNIDYWSTFSSNCYVSCF